MLDHRKTLIGRAARQVSLGMIRLVLQQFIFAFGWSWCGRIMAICILSLSTGACTWLPRAPLYAEPTPLPKLAAEIVEMPRQMCVGQTAIFTIRTNPNNECLASVRYQNGKESWVGKSLEPVVADRQGLCEWTWEVTDDAVVGTAVFRAGVEADGHVEPLIPQPFDIRACSR